MTEAATVPSGDVRNSSGADEDNGKGNDDGSADVVSYRSYQKVLTEKKNLSERMREKEEALEKLLSEKREAEEKNLASQNQYKELYEKTKQELDEQRGNYSSLISDIDTQRKIAAFLGAVGGGIAKKYHVFIDTNSILADPETGEIDEMSVTKEVERFMAEHQQLVERPHDKKTTSVYPKGEASPNKILYSEWRKLPVAEMKQWNTANIIDDN